MATLTLAKVWLNLLSTGEALSAYSEREKSQEFSLPAFDVRTYANGRRRAVSTAGEVGVLTFPLKEVSLDDKDRLRTWKGLSIQVRDNRGQKWFGTFGAMTATDDMNVNIYTVTFTLYTTTVTEGV